MVSRIETRRELPVTVWAAEPDMTIQNSLPHFAALPLVQRVADDEGADPIRGWNWSWTQIDGQLELWLMEPDTLSHTFELLTQGSTSHSREALYQPTGREQTIRGGTWLEFELITDDR